jgi:hypothetical protein
MKRSFFSPKLVLFYGGTIAAVVVLFSGVTQYGETHLRAAPKIQGQYRITQSMQACLVGRLLVIEQSGVYVNAILVNAILQPVGPPGATGGPTPNRPAGAGLRFSGLLQNQRLYLTAPEPVDLACVPLGAKATAIDVEVRSGLFTGQIKITPGNPSLSGDLPICFTAELEPSPSPKP